MIIKDPLPHKDPFPFKEIAALLKKLFDIFLKTNK